MKSNSPINVRIDGRIKETSIIQEELNRPLPAYLKWDDPPSILFTILLPTMSFLIIFCLVFIIICHKTEPVQDTCVAWHCTQLISMFLTCYIIFIFIGEPDNDLCALQPWTSLVFTLVFGNLLAKAIVLSLQAFIKWKKKEEGMLYPKYNSLHIMGIVLLFFCINTLYLIIWTAVDAPFVQEVKTSAGSHPTEVKQKKQKLSLLFIISLSSQHKQGCLPIPLHFLCKCFTTNLTHLPHL